MLIVLRCTRGHNILPPLPPPRNDPTVGVWRAALSPSLRAGHVLQVYFYSVRQWPNTSEAREKTTFGPVTGPLLFFFTRSRYSPFGIKVISRRHSRFPQKKAIRVVVPTAAFVARETREMPKERGRSGRWLFPPPPRPPRCRGDPCTGRSASRSWGKKLSNFFFTSGTPAVSQLKMH